MLIHLGYSVDQASLDHELYTNVGKQHTTYTINLRLHHCTVVTNDNTCHFVETQLLPKLQLLLCFTAVLWYVTPILSITILTTPISSKILVTSLTRISFDEPYYCYLSLKCNGLVFNRLCKQFSDSCAPLSTTPSATSMF